jgi:hypothetical protein
MTNVKPGTKLRAKRTIRYCMGQIASDKICRGEIVEVEKISPFEDGAVLLTNHADRYGPWFLEDFAIVREKL